MGIKKQNFPAAGDEIEITSHDKILGGLAQKGLLSARAEFTRRGCTQKVMSSAGIEPTNFG
jgi:hypothetical protein